MITRSIAIAVLSLIFLIPPAGAIETKEVRIANAVKRIIAVQQSDGELAAIDMLKACYQKPLVGGGTDVVLQVEECVAQDIAYANFSAGIYRKVLTSRKQPQYVTMDAMKTRVYAVTMGGGLSKDDAEKFLRIVTSIAVESLVPAIESLPKARAAEVLIEEAGLSMTLPAAWTGKYEKTKIPSGQLMQRWKRNSVAVGEFVAAPGLIVVVTPVWKDANLALISQSVLGKAPYNVKLAAETQCIKCVTFKLKMNGGIATSIAPDVPPNCTEYKPSVEADCVYQLENKINLKLEPSWANRYEKDAAFGKMFVLAVHAIVDEKFVDMSFMYPKDAADQIQPEIAAILSSIKQNPRY
jgi:hypothetical protein